MNDELKIRALMIYYDHWGKEEIRHTRDQKAFIKTMDKIKELFAVFEDDNFDFLTEIRYMTWFNYEPDEKINFINRIVECLLSEIGGSASIMSIPMPMTMTSKLAKHLNINIFDVFRVELSKEEIRQVDAIVAL